MKSHNLSYDTEFEGVLEIISTHEFFHLITKHEKIRINKWLTKLSNISVNEVWKRNRNNYIKLMQLMFDSHLIIAPFNVMPPQKDLHKLTPHEIDVIVKQIDRVIAEKANQASKNQSQHREHKVVWTQESAYIDHQKSRASHQSKREANLTTYHSSSITALSTIPPQYPKVHRKQRSRATFDEDKTTGQRLKSIQDANRHGTENLMIKERFKTFETQDLGGQDYLIKQSSVYTHENEQENNREKVVAILKEGLDMIAKVPEIEKDPEVNMLLRAINSTSLIKDIDLGSFLNREKVDESGQSNQIQGNHTDEVWILKSEQMEIEQSMGLRENKRAINAQETTFSDLKQFRTGPKDSTGNNQCDQNIQQHGAKPTKERKKTKLSLLSSNSNISNQLR